MKKLISIILALVLFILYSCDSILDKEPLDIISDANVWNDQNLIDAFLSSTYEQSYILLNEMPSATGQQWFQPFIINEMSDECLSRWLQQVSAKYGNIKISYSALAWWDQSYYVIRMLNEFIERVPESPVDDDFRIERTAEARFLRAYNYFAMVKRYGGVPLIKKVQELDDSEESLYPVRNSEKEIYDFIIAESDSIASDLSSSYDGSGRPTQYAALALKCRAALYAGSIAEFGEIQLDGILGIDASLASDYYKIAYDAAKEIIESNAFALYNEDDDKITNFKNIFLSENNSEVIFSRVHDYTDYNQGGNGWAYDFLQTPLPNAWGNGNESAPYLEMAEEFEFVDGTPGTLDREAIQEGLWTMDELWGDDRDPRFYASIYTNGTPWKDDTIDYHKGLLLPDGTVQSSGSYEGILAKGTQVHNKYGTGFGVMKYLEESKDNTGERATSGTDWILFRYSEVLLNFAEAAYELGKTGEALDAVNQIRQRAGIVDLSSIDRDKIRHERKIELFFEGHRYWDLRRWRTAVDELSVSWSGIQYILDVETNKYQIYIIEDVDGTVNPPKFYDHNYYFPITLTRTGQNPNLIENPGYE